MAANDYRMQQFMDAEAQKQRFQVLVHNINDRCWDMCVDKTGQKLESKTEACLRNCVDRFIDTSNFVVNRMETSSTASTQRTGME